MRPFGLSLTSLVLVGPALLAQAPAVAPTADPPPAIPRGGPALWARAPPVAPPAAPPPAIPVPAPAGSQGNPILPTPGTDNTGRAGVPGAGVQVNPAALGAAPQGPPAGPAAGAPA